MTPHFRPSETDCLQIAGVQHRLVRSDRSGSIWARIDEDDIRLAFTGTELLQCLSAPDTRLLRGHFSHSAALRRLRCDLQYLATCEPHRRRQALWQETWAKFFLDMAAAGETSRAERSVKTVIPELERRVNEAEASGQDVGRAPRAGQAYISFRAPCARSLLDWVRRYEAGGRSPIVFLRKRRLNADSPKLMAEAESLLAECVVGYLDRNQPTQEKIIKAVEDRFAAANAARLEAGTAQLRVPSARTVRRRIKALDPFEVEAQRKGLEAARRKFGFYEEGLPADYPLQRIEMDEWLIDIASLLGDSGALDGVPAEVRSRMGVGRRWIYVALDCATRCVLGLRIVPTPNTDDAIRTLHLITQDKTRLAEAAGCQSSWDQAGGIGVLVTDQGSAFAAELFRMAVVDLGATYEAPPAGVPKLRARVERLFRTFGQQLAPMLIGRTFGNSVERGDYPSEKWAALTDDELARIFTLFIVDIYHNTPHAGLKGETPANAWKRLSAEQGVTPPPDANTRRVVFGLANPPFGGGERREVQQNFPIKSGETAYLFLQHFIRKLKAGGRGAVVIKNTFLSNTDGASVALRKELLESCNLHTVLDCPGGTFQGAGVKTVVLFFEKGAKTRSVWYYQLDPGRSLGKTSPLNDADLAEFVALQPGRSSSPKSWMVDVANLDRTTWDLSVKNPNAPEEAPLRSPEEIIDVMLARDAETAQILEEIRGML